VVVVGLLQYLVLPYDFLKHFGYSAGTIYPYETINHNVNYIRVMSTLRGANPLGAYLVVLLSVLAAMYLRSKKKPVWQILLGVGAGLTLVLSFSRSAWIGAVLSGFVLVWLLSKTQRARQLMLAAVIVCGLVAVGILLAFRHNTTFQNTFFHTSDHSTIATSSNQGHESALKSGVRDMLHEPLGRGPGTAGPASVYNDHPGRIAENYFIQIAQETGWIGLGLFVAVNVLIGKTLWHRRDDPLALGLLAALIGVSFVNLLSHAWVDETLAYLWWGLAGIALAQKPKKSQKA
jgi:O-antigen ligase